MGKKMRFNTSRQARADRPQMPEIGPRGLAGLRGAWLRLPAQTTKNGAHRRQMAIPSVFGAMRSAGMRWSLVCCSASMLWPSSAHSWRQETAERGRESDVINTTVRRGPTRRTSASGSAVCVARSTADRLNMPGRAGGARFWLQMPVIAILTKTVKEDISGGLSTSIQCQRKVAQQ